MLIGAEVAGARRHVEPARVTLLGDGALCDRYTRALQAAGVAVRRAAPEATTRGLWRVARAAGLLKD
jgi:2-dehydro-3-deoxygalactonokinase